MNHGQDCPHLYASDPENDTDLVLRDPMKPCKPVTTDGGEVEGCNECSVIDCPTCGRAIRACGTVGKGCEFCTPFEGMTENADASPKPRSVPARRAN